MNSLVLSVRWPRRLPQINTTCRSMASGGASTQFSRAWTGRVVDTLGLNAGRQQVAAAPGLCQSRMSAQVRGTLSNRLSVTHNGRTHESNRRMSLHLAMIPLAKWLFLTQSGEPTHPIDLTTRCPGGSSPDPDNYWTLSSAFSSGTSDASQYTLMNVALYATTTQALTSGLTRSKGRNDSLDRVKTHSRNRWMLYSCSTLVSCPTKVAEVPVA